MEAPDKIYVAVDSELGFTNTKTAIAFSSEQKFSTAEYIRKDALLKKIDDAIAHLSDGSLAGYYESLVYKDIRELIKSM